MLFTDKIYGQIDITEPVILELINTPQMQRMKKIHQNGIYYYFYPQATNSRFEHSLGVYWLLKEFGANLEEQVAGLLHDISHHVFSHVIDYLFENFEINSYQDSVHHRFFKNNEVARVLEKYSFDRKKIAGLKNWPLLESLLPDICADRLEYTLADSISIGKVSQLAAQFFLKNLIIKENKFIFREADIARKFAELSLWMCQNFWHPIWGSYSSCLIVTILKKALEDGILIEEDLLTEDDLVIFKLESCQNEAIRKLLLKLKNLQIDKVIEEKSDYEFIRKVSKFRVVDPLVRVSHQVKRVTELYSDFKEKFEQEKQRVSRPRYLRYNF